MSSPILQITDLTHVYGAGTPFEHIALDHISLTVNQGEILGIVGHTGSGKSTLMQHLNGLLKPDSGQILLRGKSIWNEHGKCDRSTRFAVGLVFQYPEYQLFEETIAKDIAFGPTNMGLSEKEVNLRVQEAMEFVGLSPDFAEKSPFALSGGQKRRVAIAGVIAMRPQVLILDEPTAGLDPVGRDEILSQLQTYQRKTGATLLIVTHSMEDAARLSDRILVLCHAKVLALGTPQEVFADADKIIQAGLDIPQITKVIAALRAKGYALDPAIFTVQQAVYAMQAYRQGGAPC